MSPKERAIRESAAKLQKLGEPDLAAKLLRLIARKRKPMRKPGMGPTRAEERRARKAAQKEEGRRIRAAVWVRSVGRCEACSRVAFGANLALAALDHWLGGIGRRIPKQSVETCWWLCGACHADRTNNWPSVAYWNERFAEHCARHGYTFTPHIDKAAATSPAKEAK